SRHRTGPGDQVSSHMPSRNSCGLLVGGRMAFCPFGGSGVVHPCVVEERSVSKNVVASEGQEAVRLRVIGNEDAMELRPARASLLPGACLERPCGSVLVE